MGFTKEQLLSRLQELQISFAQYEHPVVLTVEAQAKYVGHLEGALSKNLFLKDKKQRFYVVSALAETKVDLKVLSQRLGLGKGGIRMAPEDALAEILQVPLGCVTPFSLVNESARNVSLLLDHGFKTQKCCFFHPLSNDASIAVNACDLDKFLISIGRTPAYVDLEINPAVGKDQPPDLASLVPSDTTVLPEPRVKEGSSQASENNHISVTPQPITSAAKTVKPSNGPTKEKSPSMEYLSASYADPDKFINEILEKTSSMIISKINEENMENHREQLANFVSNSISNQFRTELKNIATIFKNTAYTEGFSAGIYQQTKRL